MPLCDLCLGIDFAGLAKADSAQHVRTFMARPFELNLYQQVSKLDPREVCVPYHKSVEHLRSSATACDLCRLVLTRVDHALANRLEAIQLGHDYAIEGHELWITNSIHIDGFNVFGILGGFSGPYRDTFDLLASIRFCVEDESLLAQIVNGRKIIPTPTHPQVWDKVKGWLKDCEETHSHETTSSCFMPTRLLEVGNDTNTVCLRMGNIPFAEYTCLSHCWGTLPMRLRLTHDTFLQLTTGININQLPHNFQDAIWVTRRLGIRYLWIDSLCIFQDDREDWKREHVLMSKVYSNGTVTLAADRAADSEGGFLLDRAESEYVSLPFQTANVSGEILAFAVPLKFTFSARSIDHLGDEPLSTRAWALQERFLSRRILHFCHSQILLECETYVSEEMRAVGMKYWKGIPFRPGDFRGQAYSDWASREWLKTVSEYSKRKLTFATDKLPALVGLATHFLDTEVLVSGAHDPTSRYLAGLWSNDIVRGLCWELRPSEFSSSRPDGYRAPSWSWASLDGMVKHFPESYDGDSHLVHVKNAYVDLESPAAPFAEVTGGCLHLRVIKLDLFASSQHGPDAVCFRYSGAEWFTHIYWDVESYQIPRDGERLDAKAEAKLIAVPLRWIPKSSPAPEKHSVCGPFCLVLKSVRHHTRPEHGSIPTYQRVGTFSYLRSLDGDVDQDVVRAWTESTLMKAKVEDDMEDILIL